MKTLVTQANVWGVVEWLHPTGYWGMVLLIHGLDICFGRQTRDIMIALCALIPPGSRSCATNGLMLNLPARLSTTLVERIHMYLFSLHQAKLKKGELNRESMPNHQHMMKRTCLRPGPACALKILFHT